MGRYHCKEIQKTENWKAFRLGSPSISLPDVLAVNTDESTIFTIEAKSGTSTSLPVPADQIERCLDWIKTFDIYKKKQVLLAFKFLSKKRIDVGVYRKRELREFLKFGMKHWKLLTVFVHMMEKFIQK